MRLYNIQMKHETLDHFPRPDVTIVNSP